MSDCLRTMNGVTSKFPIKIRLQRWPGLSPYLYVLITDNLLTDSQNEVCGVIYIVF